MITKRIKKLSCILLALVILAAMMLTACGNAPTVEKPKKDTVTFYGYYDAPPAVNGNVMSNSGSPSSVYFQYARLIEYSAFDEEHYHYILAQSMEQQGNDTIITLRDGLLWSDGTPLTARDVVCTYNMLYMQDYHFWQDLESCEATDDRTVVFHWHSYSEASLIRALNIQISMSEKNYGTWAAQADQFISARTWDEENLQFKDHPAATQRKAAVMQECYEWLPELENAMCSGAYVVTSVSNSEIRLTKNPNYYKKDPENKYHWLIDEEAAAVVRRIFQLTIEGKGPYDIARILFDDKIDTPAVYFGKQNKGVWKSKEEFPNPYNWSGYIVGQILSKPEYMGHTVNFRSHKQSYKDKNAVMNPREDWLIFEDTHEAIVDRETWELAQKLRKTPKRIDTLGEANPLTGLLYCADCGEKMYNHRSKGGTENNPYPSDFFDCSAYTLAHQKRTSACFGHYISTKALRTLILDTIRTVSTFAISNQEAFMEKVRSASQLQQAEAAKDAKRKLSKDKKRIAELDTIIKKLYESFAVGRITDERFDRLLADYEAEQKALQTAVAEAEEKLSAFAEDTARVEQFLELAKKYTDFSELTTPMINEFIEKIIVHAPERIDGDRVQEVEIHLRFIGQFELPAPELTEEEIKRQEQLKRHRIKSRERYQKIKAGEHAVGQPFMLTCKCCGQEFASKRTNTLFCGPNCRAKFYRQEAAESRSRECTCENCGKVFPTTRSSVKYCSDACRYAAQIKRQGVRKKALREAKIEPAVPEKETKTA